MHVLTICFFINLFVCIDAKSQQVLTALSSEKQQVVYDTTQKTANTVTSKVRFNINTSGSVVKPVPSAYYFNSLGFFCQKELQIEKMIKFPVKFRLGSVGYTDQMEGKGKGRQ